MALSVQFISRAMTPIRTLVFLAPQGRQMTLDIWCGMN
jgi:hypothetical protein